MSMTIVIIAAAAVLVLLLLGAGVIVFVLKSRGGNKSASAAGAPGMQQFPQPPQAQSFGAPDAAPPASWPPPQQQAQPWGAPATTAEPPAADWGGRADPFPPPADPFPPQAPAYPQGGEPDPYATTPSVDATDAMGNPDLFMTTPSTPRQTSMDVAPARLTADDGSVIALNRDSMRVGRHPECDVVIPTPGTSRQHAEFAFRDGAWLVTDLNSGNGTFVNNVRVRSQQLSPGDEIRIDQTRFTFSPGA